MAQRQCRPRTSKEMEWKSVGEVFVSSHESARDDCPKQTVRLGVGGRAQLLGQQVRAIYQGD